MTCDTARAALLTADLPVARNDASALGTHLLSCDACARLAVVLQSDTERLRGAVCRRSRARLRIGVTVGTVAAAAIIALVLRGRIAKPVSSVARSATAPSGVTVQVAPGKQATVIKTKDPSVTIVWLSNEAGGGL